MFILEMENFQLRMQIIVGILHQTVTYSLQVLSQIQIIVVFFFFEREFQPMTFAPNNSSLLSDQDINQFWCRRRLNPRFLIQPSETLPVELTGTHKLQLFCQLISQNIRVRDTDMVTMSSFGTRMGRLPRILHLNCVSLFLSLIL